MTTYPDDDDGAVLSDLAVQGVDMSSLMLIDFTVAVPDESTAYQVNQALIEAGYETQIDYDEGEPDFDPEVDDPEEFGPMWTIFANIQMVPEYDEIIRIQTDLDRICKPLGGKSDGWGVMIERDEEE